RSPRQRRELENYAMPTIAAVQATSKIGLLRDLLFNLLQEHKQDGTIPTNARFLFYELVQRGQLSKEKTGVRRPDQDLHDALTDNRAFSGQTCQAEAPGTTDPPRIDQEVCTMKKQANISFGQVTYASDAPTDAPTWVWKCECRKCRKARKRAGDP